MTISQNSFVGSFMLSFFTPWRTNDRSGRDFVAVAKSTVKSKEDHVSTAVNLKISTRPSDSKSQKFKLGHRRSAATSLASITPEERASLNQLANTLRSQMQDHNSVTQSKTNVKNSRQQNLPLSPIQEEAESAETGGPGSISYGHNLTPSISAQAEAEPNFGPSPNLSSEGLPSIAEEEEEELGYLFPSLPAIERAEDVTKPCSGQTVSLRSEVNHLQSQLDGAHKEIESLKADLAEVAESEELIREAEERMEELLIEKTGWIKNQRALAQNIAILTDELQSEKTSRNSLQRDNEILREVIQLYQTSLEALRPHATLIHQDAIESHTAMLTMPLTGLLPTRETPDSKTPPAHCTGLATPPRTPCLRSARSLRLKRSTSLAGLKVMADVTNDGSLAKNNYKPFEGSPLRLVTTSPSPEEDQAVGDRVYTLQKMSSLDDSLMFFEQISPTSGKEQEEEFYDCEDDFESIMGSPGGRTSRLAMISDDDFFL